MSTLSLDNKELDLYRTTAYNQENNSLVKSSQLKAHTVENINLDMVNNLNTTSTGSQVGRPRARYYHYYYNIYIPYVCGTFGIKICEVIVFYILQLFE